MTHNERLKFFERKFVAATNEQQRNKIAELFEKEIKARIDDDNYYVQTNFGV